MILVITASMPSWPPFRETTGTPPPPAATTTTPRSSSVRTDWSSSTRSGLGRRHDTSPAAAGILLHGPAALLLQCSGARGVVEGADRLGRVLKRGVVLVHLDARHDDGHRASRRRLELGRPRARRSRPGSAQRQRRAERRGLGARELLPEQLVAHLRAVSMRDREGTCLRSGPIARNVSARFARCSAAVPRSPGC